MSLSRMEADLDYKQAELDALQEETRVAELEQEARDNRIEVLEAEIEVLESSMGASPEAERAFLKAKNQEKSSSRSAEKKPKAAAKASK